MTIKFEKQFQEWCKSKKIEWHDDDYFVLAQGWTAAVEMMEKRDCDTCNCLDTMKRCDWCYRAQTSHNDHWQPKEVGE